MNRNWRLRCEFIIQIEPFIYIPLKFIWPMAATFPFLNIISGIDLCLQSIIKLYWWWSTLLFVDLGLFNIRIIRLKLLLNINGLSHDFYLRCFILLLSNWGLFRRRAPFHLNFPWLRCLYLIWQYCASLCFIIPYGFLQMCITESSPFFSISDVLVETF